MDRRWRNVARSAVLCALAGASFGSAVAPAAAQMPWQRPGAIGFSPDGRHVYASDGYDMLVLDRDRVTGALGLSQQTSANYGGATLEVAPDGRSVYATSGMPAPGGDRREWITAWTRDTASGRLTRTTVTGTAERVADIGDMVVSPDGRQLYATDRWGSTKLLTFARDPATGALAYAREMSLPGVAGLALSRNGRWLHVGSTDRIATYERAANGTLALRHATDCGALYCAPTTLLLSSDETRAYSGPYSLTAFDRSVADATLSNPVETPLLQSGGEEIPGATMAVRSPFLYALDIWTDRLHQLSDASGALSFVRSYQDARDGTRGMSGATSVAISPDGAHLYVGAAPSPSGQTPGTIAAFRRNAATGQLAFASLFTGPMNGEPLRATINGGSPYTNDPDVTVTVTGTDAQAYALEFANDGGFRDRLRRQYRGSGRYPWRLLSTGPERLAKTVYVRAASPLGSTGAPASDSIILDETAPRVLAARRVRPRHRARGAVVAARSSAKRRIRVRARDRTSGVSRLQFAQSKRGKARWRRYSRKKAYAVSARVKFVRVRDRAGNRSRWRRLARPK